MLDIDKLWFVLFMLTGSGLFYAMTFPCLNGPLNVLLILRQKFGKPFSCPTCAFFWGVVITAIIIELLPLTLHMMVSASGWGMLLMHISGYQVVYQGMEDE